MKATLTAFALASLAGCAVADSDADTTTTSSDIIGGQRENGLPAVGAISYDGSWGCTGTLIGPYRVLTAAHLRAHRTQRAVRAPRGSSS